MPLSPTASISEYYIINVLYGIKSVYFLPFPCRNAKLNAEKLLFNWQLGRDLVLKKAEERWGTGVVEQVSLDLHAEFPNDKGFSTRNLWYMKQWYEFYTREPQFLQRVVAEIQIPDLKLQRGIGACTITIIRHYR